MSKSKTAQTITDNTILGFVTETGVVYFVDADYNVRNLDTNERIVIDLDKERHDWVNSKTLSGSAPSYVDDLNRQAATMFPQDFCDVGDAVYGRDIKDGISMTVKSKNQTIKNHVGISISTMRVSGGDRWDKVTTLTTVNAIKLMHKWYMEHGLLRFFKDDHNLDPIVGFSLWVRKHVNFFLASDKLHWFENSLKIKYEMESRSCDFHECMCNMKVPNKHELNVIPHQYYEDFNIFTELQYRVILAKANPVTNNDANMALHKARLGIE